DSSGNLDSRRSRVAINNVALPRAIGPNGVTVTQINPAWQPNHVYSVNDAVAAHAPTMQYVKPGDTSSPPDLYWVCVGRGTSGSGNGIGPATNILIDNGVLSPPDKAQTFTDGTVTWQIEPQIQGPATAVSRPNPYPNSPNGQVSGTYR